MLGSFERNDSADKSVFKLYYRAAVTFPPPITLGVNVLLKKKVKLVSESDITLQKLSI